MTHSVDSILRSKVSNHSVDAILRSNTRQHSADDLPEPSITPSQLFASGRHRFSLDINNNVKAATESNSPSSALMDRELTPPVISSPNLPPWSDPSPFCHKFSAQPLSPQFFCSSFAAIHTFTPLCAPLLRSSPGSNLPPGYARTSHKSESHLYDSHSGDSAMADNSMLPYNSMLSPREEVEGCLREAMPHRPWQSEPVTSSSGGLVLRSRLNRRQQRILPYLPPRAEPVRVGAISEEYQSNLSRDGTRAYASDESVCSVSRMTPTTNPNVVKQEFLPYPLQTHTGSNPIHSRSNPIYSRSNPIHFGSNPIHTGSNPIHSGSNPLRTGSILDQSRRSSTDNYSLNFPIDLSESSNLEIRRETDPLDTRVKLTSPTNISNTNPAADNTKVCSVCNRCYSHESSLRRHQQTHVKVKFVCQVCGAEFSRRDSLGRHERSFHIGRGRGVAGGVSAGGLHATLGSPDQCDVINSVSSWLDSVHGFVL